MAAHPSAAPPAGRPAGAPGGPLSLSEADLDGAAGLPGPAPHVTSCTAWLAAGRVPDTGTRTPG